VELRVYLHFHSNIRLHVVELNKALEEHQQHRALAAGTSKARGVKWTGNILLVKTHKQKQL
jgi:hypothetical protein